MKVSYREQHIELEKNEGIYITDETSGIEFIQRDEETLFIVTKNKVLTVRCLEINKDEKKITLLHEGQKTHLSLAEPMDELLKSMGLEGALTAKINDLKAPMPGLVLDVVITAGDIKNKTGIKDESKLNIKMLIVVADKNRPNKLPNCL